MPILGADFLTHYKLSVELASQTLTDTSTNIQRCGFISKYSTIGTDNYYTYSQWLRRDNTSVPITTITVNTQRTCETPCHT